MTQPMQDCVASQSSERVGVALYRQICESRRNDNSVASLTNPNPTGAVPCRAGPGTAAVRVWGGSGRHLVTLAVRTPSCRRRRRRRRRRKSRETSRQLSCLRRHRVAIVLVWTYAIIGGDSDRL